MRHSSICELRLSHAYFPDGGCPDAVLLPRSGTRRLVERHRMRISPRPRGIALSTARDSGGSPLVPLGADDHLELILRATGAAFYLYTDFAGTPPGKLMWYRSDWARHSGGELRRTGSVPRLAEDGADAAALITLRAADLSISAVSSGTGVRDTVSFTLKLEARARRWRYYCVTAASLDAADLRIVDRRSPRDLAGIIEFPASGRLDPGDASTAKDPVARDLAVRFPGKRILSFTSSAAVPVRAAASRHLALMLGDHPLVEHLPNPPLGNLWADPDALGSGGLRDDVAYRTVEVLTQPSHNFGA